MLLALFTLRMSEIAVSLRGACKQYGRGKNVVSVLAGLDMTVEEGSIYALLGSSGCGKTTLLNCVVGRLSLNAGALSVFGVLNSGVPGERLGYMPQDIGLIEDFSIKQSIFYFGWLTNLKSAEIREQYDFLQDLLELPPENQQIKNLSGGQKRRVSFACALIQKCKLLILDEPTVGLDPILRQTIWDFLKKISVEDKVTVMITTHYIEEAGQAHKIGIMRQGKLLAEGHPQRLLELYECSNIEELFLQLSVKQSQGVSELEGELSAIEESKHEGTTPEEPTQVEPSVKRCARRRLLTSHRMSALMYKNLLGFSYLELIITIVLPLLQITIFNIAIGKLPRGLQLAVVNKEMGNFSTCQEFSNHYNIGVINNRSCSLFGISCLFLSQINDTVPKMNYYATEEDALAAVKKHQYIGMVSFSANYSKDLGKRWRLGRNVRNETVDGSELQVRLDTSDMQTSRLVKIKMYAHFADMLMNLSTACGMSAKFASVPMDFKEPVYGERFADFYMYFGPKFISIGVFSMAIYLTCNVIGKDMESGIWDRNYIAGVTMMENVLSHMLSQLITAFWITLEILLLSLYLFGMECKGSPFSMFFTSFLQGILGITSGLVISAIFPGNRTSTLICNGTTMAAVFFTGLIWPVEGMPSVMKTISLLTPVTQGNLGLSYIVVKGLSVFNSSVYIGILITIGWIVCEFLITVGLLTYVK